MLDTSPRGPDADRLHLLARNMLANGRLVAARASTNALRRLIGDQPDFAALEVQLLRCEGRTQEASEHLDNAIARMPGAVTLRVCRAEARLSQGDTTGAAVEAAEAVTLDPGNTGAKALLGMALLELGWLDEATACLDEALHAAPENLHCRLGLSSALERNHRRDEAVAVLEHGFGHATAGPALRVAAITAELRRSRYERAVDLANDARRDGIADACVFGLLGHALSSLGRHEAASDAYVEALKLAPEDPYVRHLVAASGKLPSADRAPVEYVRTVFDGYAERFDEHLMALGYRVPGLLRAKLLAEMPALRDGCPLGPVLDLGCGTGLVGVVLSDLPLDGLVGVDLSGRMLEHAERRGVYTELHRCDIELFLAGDGRSWPLIIAADVLCYLGALETIFTHARMRLTPDGRFMFTVETASQAEGADAKGWRLERLGRFAHGVAYIERCATQSGLRVRSIEPQTMRHEVDSPVSGLLVVMERALLDG